MNAPHTAHPLSILKALGVVEGCRNDILSFRAVLQDLSFWLPRFPLLKQCDAALEMIENLEERIERKLVVTLIGPSGSGKSTILNALAGVDDLSETGVGRPTTRSLIVLGREKEDAAQIGRRIGNDNVQVRTSPAADSLEHVLLIDTPDTDSSEQARHLPLIREAVALSDVLICVFNAENPKGRDHADVMAPLVRLFSGGSLLVALNRCDRLNEAELRESILPEFSSYLERAWEKPAPRVLCISARRNLRNPGWDERAAPRHEFDQFPELREAVFGAFNRPGCILHRRLENAQSIREHVLGEIRTEAAKDEAALEKGGERMRRAGQKGLEAAVSALRTEETEQVFGVNVLLYQKLSQRWAGPVGWLVALWARLLMFGTGMVALFRLGNPVTQLYGLVTSALRFKGSSEAIRRVREGRADVALLEYRLAVLREWPDVAEALVGGRFAPSVRRIEEILPEVDAAGVELSAIWKGAIEEALEQAAGRMSGGFLQLVLNLPSLAVLGYAGWKTGLEFFSGRYFPSDFFIHAFLTFAIVLFFGFFFLQGLIRIFAPSGKITGNAFGTMRRRLENLQSLPKNPVGEEVEKVLGLTRSGWV